MADEIQTNPAGVEVDGRFSCAGTFEHAETGSGWDFRPNTHTARFVAHCHAVFLTLMAGVVLLPCVLFVWFFVADLFVDRSRGAWFATTVGIGCGLTLIGSTPLLVAWARHIFQKSLRDNWLTMRVAPGGPILLGAVMLVEAGRARHIVVRSVEESSEGETVICYRIEVVLDRECAAPVDIPIPRHGMWMSSAWGKRDAKVFAEVLARARGHHP